ncbi:DUF6270 domain-containing protein [Methanobrevibacter sp.]|uniref:DUF6270 domain-containing protein n=1 Tax=Methanobrevibacter sp. TaxID=66852 RepID=UPI0025F25FE1|nr:DUF6270 domain-containing protein [Methanobrevibacter sp.]MBQ6512732.1 hypothetical protein [Methanobrevibacter sp.]
MGKITEFSVFGSCSSRGIFNSLNNENYKKYFKINHSVEGSSLISIMSKPIDYDKSLINSNRRYDNLCVTEDLSKSFVDFIKEDSIDYIILDTLFDVKSGVIQYDKNQYVTGTTRIKRTGFYNLLKNKRSIDVFNDFDEYYGLWTNACNDFFKLIDQNCNRTRVILNCTRSVYKYLDSQYNISVKKDYKLLAHKLNPFRDLFDRYILENFDVDVLPFDCKTLANENHIDGLAPTHFVPEYFSKKTEQLLEIIQRNNSFDNEMNRKIRKNKSMDVINSFNLPHLINVNNITLVDKKNLVKNLVEDSLIKYNTARIDIKNYGENSDVENHIKINYSSDENLEYSSPDWFKDSQGQGTFIRSQDNFLKLDIECIGDGQLKIKLRGESVKLNEKRVPIYIKYTKFLINGDVILKDNEVVYYERPYVYNMNVFDGQKLSLYIEWLPF